MVVSCSSPNCPPSLVGSAIPLRIDFDIYYKLTVLLHKYSVLTVQCNVNVQRVGFLPARDSEDEVVWVTLEESQLLPDIDWQILTFTPPPEQDNSKYRKNNNVLVVRRNS